MVLEMPLEGHKHTDLLPSCIDLGSIEEIDSTVIGDRHQPFSNLQEEQEDAKVSHKAKCFPTWEATLNSKQL